MFPDPLNSTTLLPPALQAKSPNEICFLTASTQLQQQLIALLLSRHLYHNPITATVREIISNAIDATIQLPTSQRQPIEIHLPSKTELFFAVTDHATGMSPQEVKNLYLNYGTSTKTDNPPQIGSYGIGAQAPLSYTQTFVMTTVKDQQETTCLINLQQVQLYTNKTTVANGTRVKIPLSNERDIAKFFTAVKTYAMLPIAGIQLTGLQPVQKEIHPYGDVIFCGNIQVAQQNLPVYWHCIDRSSEISGRQFFNYFGEDYSKLKHVLYFSDTLDLSDNWDNLKQWFQISAVLGGFEYPLFSYPTAKAEFVIGLQPGMVNVSYNREEIVADDKRQQLLNAFYQQIIAVFFNTIKTVGLRNLVNAEMFPWAVRACARVYLHNPELVSVDPTLIKQLFTNRQHVNLWEVTPRPLGLLDLQAQPPVEIELNLKNLYTQKQLLNLLKTHFDNPQQRPSLFNLEVSRYFEAGDFQSWDIFDFETSKWDQLCSLGVINVVTDLNHFNLVKKVLRKRKKLIKSTHSKTAFPNILLLFQEPQVQVQPVIEQILAGIPITINYFSSAQVEQL